MEYMQKIQQYHASFPVDVLGIARAFGLMVFSDYLGTGISGRIARRPDLNPSGHYIIVVNSSDAKVRQRFTVAHEIAHFLLHKESIGNGIDEDAMHRSIGLSNWQEVEANRLAADILMPYHLINACIQSGINSVEGLAESFEVSPIAMGIRLGVQS